MLAWADFIDMIKTPPHSLWFVFVICLLVVSLSTFLNKILVDHDRVARIQKQINNHNQAKKALLDLAEENPKKYRKEYKKWSRRDESIKKMQQKMTFERMKPTCFTFIPLIAFFYMIRSIYTPYQGAIQLPVARPPMNPMQELPAFFTAIIRSEAFSVLGDITINMGFLSYSGWYMLCSFTVSTIMQRLFGIAKTTQQAQGSGGLFDSAAQMELPDPKTL